MFAGLERIAEELMGRRKWHQYQDILAKNYLLEEELMDRREWVPVKTCNSCDVNADLSAADHSPAELVRNSPDHRPHHPPLTVKRFLPIHHSPNLRV